MRKAILFLSAAAMAVTPIAGSAQVRYLNPKDVAEARRQHAAMVQEFGGAETGPRAAYAESVGRRVSAQTGVANGPNAFNFTLLNSAVENAFSVPGGYVYMTRQLMTLMDNEAELAFALGHEVGHVAANHAKARENAASRQSVLGVLGAVLGSVFGGGVFGNVISQNAQRMAALSVLRFSREQEYEADTLALRYLIGAGYDPAGGPGILAALARSTALQARIQGRENRQLPEWASTHPLSENRMQRARIEVQQTGRLGTGIRNRDVFLNQLQGVTVDDDPSQGVIDGRYFTHPGLRIQFAVPAGYLMQNGARAVSIKGSGGEAEFSGGRYTGTMESYILAVYQDLTEGKQRLNIPQPRRTTVNGIPVAFTTTRAQTSSGVLDVSVVAYQWDRNTIYHFVMITQAGQGIAPFVPMVNSLRRITAAEAAAIRPRVIDVVAVRPGDTVQSLASRMAYRDFQVERFLSLNGLYANQRLSPGQRVKIVIYGPRRR